MNDRLAIHGGTPVRTAPFPSKMLGAAWIGDEELEEIRQVVVERSPFRHYGVGNPVKTKQFEQEAKALLGSKYVLAVSSGSAALSCAIAALEIGPGDEVIMPAFEWYSDYYSVVHAGALPVFAEIDESLNLDPKDFEAKITKHTKAVIVVHYQGGPAKLDEILAIAARHDIKVIEDCAQSFGGTYRGKFLGTLGDIGISSFQANKMITCGEGGLFYTDNEAYFARAVRFHDLGLIRDVFKEQLTDQSLASDDCAIPGLQFRMSELHGAFLLAQLRKLPRLLEKSRRQHAAIVNAFRDSRHFRFRPEVEGDCGTTIFMKFPSPAEASAFGKALAAEGIPLGPSSNCKNMLDCKPIQMKKMVLANIPPFGKGFNGEHVVYDPFRLCPRTNEIVASHVAIGIGALYTDRDIEDMIRAIAKVENGLHSTEQTR